MGKDISLLEDACKFTSRLLETGTVAEIMYLRKTVGTQLMNLISNTPKTEGSYSVEFQTDFSEFEKVVKEAFGRFKTESSKSPVLKEMSPVSVTSSLPPLTINGHNINLTNGSSLTNSSPISLPTSMQSSFDGDLGANLQGLSLAQSPPVVQPVTAPNLQGYATIAEYNIAALASLADSNTSTAASPTPPPPFPFAEFLTSENAYKNLASLAKLGLSSGM